MSNPTAYQLDIQYKTGLPIKAISRIVLGVEIDSLHDDWVRIFEHNCAHRGKPETIKYMKLLYGQATSYSLYQPIPFIPLERE